MPEADDSIGAQDRFGRWLDRNAMKTAIIIVVLVSLLAVGGVAWEADRRTDAIAEASAERRDQICTEARNLRDLVSELIGVTVEGDPLDVSQIESWARLPEEARRFVADVLTYQAIQQDRLEQRLNRFRDERLSSLPDYCT